jgi:hypothetical protein
MLKSFISYTLLFLMLKINVLIKDLPNLQSPKIQSPKIMFHSLQIKDLFRYDFSHTNLETLYTM